MIIRAVGDRDSDDAPSAKWGCVKEQKLSTAAAPFFAEFDRDMLTALQQMWNSISHRCQY